jgi:gliding motility-associated-like protein
MNHYKLRSGWLVLVFIFLFNQVSVAQSCDSLIYSPNIHGCKGGSVLLNVTKSGSLPLYSATWSGTGLSDYNILSPTATLGLTGASFILTAYFEKPTNLIVNGDFELGDRIDYTTDYDTLQPGSTYSGPSEEDSSIVCSDPSTYSPTSPVFPSMGDHTTTSGGMLLVNGSTDTSKNFWCYGPIAVNPATDYDFSFWAAKLDVPEAGVQIIINTTPVKAFGLSKTTPVAAWKKYSFVWNSAGNTSAYICMNDTSKVDYGNDFVIDDISMHELCLQNAFINVDVSDFKPQISVQSKLCKKDITVTGIDSTNPNLVLRNWDFGDGNTDTGYFVKHTYANEGSYTVHYTETDSYGCLDSATAKVSIVTTSTKIHASGDTTICKGGTAQLYSEGGISYMWTPKQGLSDTAAPDPFVTPDSARFYYVTAVDTQGCTGKDTVQIKFFPPVVLDITPNREPITCENSSTQLFVTGAKKYIWQPGNYCDSNTSSHPIVSPPTTTTFFVYGTDGKGCDGRDSITIICLKDSAYIPNAFTPNGDGINDIIYPKSYCNFIFKNFSVYNRWGQLMFSSDKYGEGWDGTHKGEQQQQGVYIYEIRGYKLLTGDQVDKVETIIKGNITLLR